MKSTNTVLLEPVLGLALALSASPAAAQGHEMFGISVTGLGDVDGDGRSDFAVGDPAFASPGYWTGRVWIVSGADWRPLRVLDGKIRQTQFGATLANAGDLDRDGVDDLLVGSTPKDRKARVGAFSGATGEPLYEFELPAEDGMKVWWSSSASGPALAGIGDVDGDGRGDFVVGVPYDDGAAPNAGLVQARSGRDGEVLFELRGRSACDRFGSSLAAAGDIDGDGKQDVIAGAMPERDSNAELEAARGYRPGYAVIFSGADGAALRVLESPEGTRRFGVAVAGAGDLDRDGTPDVLVSSSFWDWMPTTRRGAAGTSDSGEELLTVMTPKVRAFSGADGSLLHTWSGGDEQESFGARVLSLDDLDDDGVPDLLMTAPQPLWGSELDVAVWSGSGSGEARALPSGERDGSGSHRGVSVARLGDLDGDGLDDVAVGAASIRAGGDIPGLLYVYSTGTGDELARLSRAEFEASSR